MAESATFTPKQQLFVKEYLVDLNGTQAAIRAGYSKKTARNQASAMLAKLHIQEAIQAAFAERAARVDVTADMVLDEYARLGFANMLDYVEVQADGTAYVDLSALTRDQAAAIQEVTIDTYVEGSGEASRDVRRVKFKLADKRGALDSMGRHLGMFVDRHRHEHTGRGGGPIEHKSRFADMPQEQLDALIDRELERRRATRGDRDQEKTKGA